MKSFAMFVSGLLLLALLLLPRTASGIADKSAPAGQPDPPGAVTLTPTTVPTSEPTPGPTSVPTTPTPIPSRDEACLRINFEVSGDEALAGTYQAVEVGGRLLATWEAEAGWQDSGWIREIDTTFSAVHVRVLYLAGAGADPVEMQIVNPAPNTPYGWVAEGMCHSLEVAWP